MTDQSDRQAIERCLAGDQQSFEELVRRHQGLVYNLCCQMVGDREQANDLAQETFIKAYLRLREYRGSGQFRSWLCRIASRTCLDYLRSVKGKQWLPLEEQMIGTDEDPLDAVRRDDIKQAISQLPPHYRAVMGLRHQEGFSYQEIAQALGLPLATVKTHLSRARALLRRRLEES